MTTQHFFYSFSLKELAFPDFSLANKVLLFCWKSSLLVLLFFFLYSIPRAKRIINVWKILIVMWQLPQLLSKHRLGERTFYWAFQVDFCSIWWPVVTIIHTEKFLVSGKWCNLWLSLGPKKGHRLMHPKLAILNSGRINF